MTTFLHLVSLLFIVPVIAIIGFAAFARPKSSAQNSLAQFWHRLFSKTAVAVVAEPRIITDNGWTTIICDNYLSFKDWLGHDESGLPPFDDEPQFLGSHLLIELYDCQKDLLETEITVGNAMRQAAVDSNATVVAESFHEFKPYGVSGAVIIQESHYTIHTWPEHGYAAVDLFYCGGTVQVHRAVELLRERFKPQRLKFMVVRRGIQSEVQGVK